MKFLTLWLVDHSVAKKALFGQLTEEKKIECQPEKVTNALIDENVDLYIWYDVFLLVMHGN